MKNLFPLLVACCLVLFSCQVDNDEFLDETNTNLSFEQNQKQGMSPDQFSYGGGPSEPTPAELFELKMEWAAYITAEILWNNPSLRVDLNNLYDSQTKTIPLEDLIGDNTRSQNFHDEFIIFLQLYIDCEAESCPDTSDGPGEPICPECIGLVDPPTKIFIDQLVEYNCTELYFPRDINFSWAATISTTAHPLTNYYANEGYRRTGTDAITYIAAITPNYINLNNHTIIVTRPVRDIWNTTCDYIEYPVTDFTDFLDGPW